MTNQVANGATSSVVSVANTTTVVLAARNDVIGLTLSNAADEAIDVSFGSAAATGKGVSLGVASAPYNVPVQFKGLAVNAICASGTKNLAVTVFTETAPSVNL